LIVVRHVRKVCAILAGGSVSGMVVLHFVHVASIAAGSTALQFVCQIGH
jgi:hypothetical protein